jgi:hypothetical protein
VCRFSIRGGKFLFFLTLLYEQQQQQQNDIPWRKIFNEAIIILRTWNEYKYPDYGNSIDIGSKLVCT